MADTRRWSAAHLVTYIRFLQGPQAPHYLMENVVLVQASSRDEVQAKAKRKADEEYAVEDPTFTCDGRRARWEYLGVREFVECDDPGTGVVDGVEVTYLEYSVPDANALDRLMRGEEVTVDFDAAPAK